MLISNDKDQITSIFDLWGSLTAVIWNCIVGVLQAIWNWDICESGTIFKRKFSDASHAIRYDKSTEMSVGPECPISNRCQCIRKYHRNQTITADKNLFPIDTREDIFNEERFMQLKKCFVFDECYGIWYYDWNERGTKIKSIFADDSDWIWDSSRCQVRTRIKWFWTHICHWALDISRNDKTSALKATSIDC